MELEPGESCRFTPAIRPNRMVVLLEGEIRSQLSTPKCLRGSSVHPAVTGMLPYSRMKTFPATARAVVHTRAAYLPADRFSEMLERLPILRPRLVRRAHRPGAPRCQMQVQTEKLAALGKISAGLAHELNNPAAAAQRAVGNLREAFQTFREAAARLNAHELSAAQRAAIPSARKRTGASDRRRPWIRWNAAIARTHDRRAGAHTASRALGSWRRPWWTRAATSNGSTASPNNSRRRP